MKKNEVSLANGKEALPWVFNHRKIVLLTWEHRSTLVRLCVWEFSSGFFGAVESNSWSDLSPLICTLTVNGCSNRDPAKSDWSKVLYFICLWLYMLRIEAVMVVWTWCELFPYLPGCPYWYLQLATAAGEMWTSGATSEQTAPSAKQTKHLEGHV